MHVELVDLFRCTQPHEDSWLVAAAHVKRDRVIVEGLLGCPVCGAEYAIRDGVAYFDVAHDSAANASRGPTSAGAISRPDSFGTKDSQGTAREGGLEEQAFRLAAQLDLDVPGKTVALVGFDSKLVSALADIAKPRMLLMDCPGADATAFVDVPAAVLHRIASLPVAMQALDAVATATFLPDNAAGLLRSNGRLVAPEHLPLPPSVNELARDNLEWVAAREVTHSRPVQLRRHSSP